MPEKKYIFQLNEILSMDTLTTILSYFSVVTSLPVLVTDYQGKPLTETKNFHPICRELRASKDCLLCEKCDAYAGLEVYFTGKPFIYKCHMGFVDAAVPILVNGNYIGVVLTGQICVEDSYMQRLPQVLPELLHPGPPKEAPLVPYQRFAACVQLLFTMTNYFAEIGARNIMQQKLNEQETRLLQETRSHAELKRALARLELQNMQSQMNPLFLFNTLNTIHHLSVLEDAPQTSETIAALAELLRWSLSESDTLITLGDEINRVKTFLFIQSITLRNRIKVECSFDETCFNCLIPPYTLQPLVENSFTHGLIPREEGGTVKIKVKHLEDRVFLEVEDDGVGMPRFMVEELYKLKAGENKLAVTSLGIRNVVRTLEHYFNGNFDWQLESRQGVGTRFSLSLPFWSHIGEEESS